MLSTMPRLTASRASPLWLQWLRGRSLCSGGSQASAMIAQTCSGVNVAGAPGRGSSASRTAIVVPGGAASQRARHSRTVFGQTSSRRAISRTPVPADDSRIMVARSASLRGVLCARLSRSKLSSSSEVRRIGVADSRGMREFRRIGAGFRLAPCHTGVPLTRRQTPRQAPL